jgi:hypothetical protein
MEEFGFCVTGMACNGGSQFWPDYNGLEWRKSVLAGLEWLGLEEVNFSPTEMAWNGRTQFWPDWNSLECWKSVMA